ncbi:MAG TPA: caspase family protein [Xanthomonadales bacterium]|nr:caspase family protein [Xanthomonadales bacterium]
MTKKLALAVGINEYESNVFENLTWCEADAEAMKNLLANHWGPEKDVAGPRNYNARSLTSAGGTRISADKLRQDVSMLMNHSMGEADVLFYFSGHGVANDEGGFLVTQDGTPENPGYPMKELLDAANRSGNPSVTIILDCCHSGQIGNITDGEGLNRVSISPNVTILAGAGATQKAAEDWDHSLFTGMMLEALNGGASDVRGEVTAAAVYAYLEQSLGPWEQTPVYKSYARKFLPLRRCEPVVPDKILAQLPRWFRRPDSKYPMDPSYEYTDDSRDPVMVEIFEQFKDLRNGNLLTTNKWSEEDYPPHEPHTHKELYWSAMTSDSVRLTPQGRLMWKRAKRGDFGG